MPKNVLLNEIKDLIRPLKCFSNEFLEKVQNSPFRGKPIQPNSKWLMSKECRNKVASSRDSL